MNPETLTEVKSETTREFVYLRLEQRFDRFTAVFDHWPAAPYEWLRYVLLALLAVAALTTITLIARRFTATKPVTPGPRPAPSLSRILKITCFLSWFFLICTALAIYFVNETFRPPSPPEPEMRPEERVRNAWKWRWVYGITLLIASVYTIWQYARESRAIRWYWAAFLSLLRLGVYAGLLFVFLLPAYRERTTITQQGTTRSRVAIVLDVSPSMTLSGAELKGAAGVEARIATVVDLLTDDQVALVRELLKNHPIVVYRFAHKHDPEPHILTNNPEGDGTSQDWAAIGHESAGRSDFIGLTRAWAGKAAGTAGWNAFVRGDLRPHLLRGLSDDARRAIVAHSPGWTGAEPAPTQPGAKPAPRILDGSPEWARTWIDSSGIRVQETAAKKEGEPGGETQAVIPAWFQVAPEAARDDAHRKELIEQRQKDANTLLTNIGRVEDRIRLAREMAAGTKVPEAVDQFLDREIENGLRGMIVFSDGKSHESRIKAENAADKARKQRIPVFTVAVGENIYTAEIRIAGIRSPKVSRPEQPIDVTVKVEGRGLKLEEVEAKLDVFVGDNRPTPDQKPTFTVSDQRSRTEILKNPTAVVPYKIRFDQRQPPTGEVTFKINPDDYYTDEGHPLPSGHPQLADPPSASSTGRAAFKLGRWWVRVRVDRHPKETQSPATEKEHVRESEEPIVINDQPLRVLLMASAPSREFQALRTLLIRGVQDKSAILCIRLQNEGGTSGDIAQEVPEKQILQRFPSKYEVVAPKAGTPKAEPPKEPGLEDPKKDEPTDDFDNLAIYDLIIAIDADWTELNAVMANNLKKWVENRGGGLIFVAGTLRTPILSEVPSPDSKKKPKDPGNPDDPPASERGNAHLLALLELLPVIPDSRAVLGTRPIPKVERRLRFYPPGDSDLLRIDDPATRGLPGGRSDPTAGWELFFTDQDRYLPTDPETEMKPRRGFYSSYPVMTPKSPEPSLADYFNVKQNGLKPSAVLLAEYLYPDPRSGAMLREPWLAVMEKIGLGRTMYIGSGELYRMVGFDKDMYNRFWWKMFRYVTQNKAREPYRGEFQISGNYSTKEQAEIVAKVLDLDSTPYLGPRESRPGKKSITPKVQLLRVIKDQQDRETGTEPVGELIELNPRTEANGSFQGYYTVNLPADEGRLPGSYRVVMDLPDPGPPGPRQLREDFEYIKPNNETDDIEPNEAALRVMATALDKDMVERLDKEDPQTLERLQSELERVDTVDPNGEIRRETKLFFRISQRGLIALIPKLVTKPAPPPPTKLPGETRYEEIWDRGFEPDPRYTNWIVPGQHRISYVLLAIVGLLALEWTCRKLLRLA